MEEDRVLVSSNLKRSKLAEEIGILGGLIAVQCVYAGNSVLQSYLLSLGVNPLSFIVFTAFATFVLLSPFCIIFERKQWPRNWSFKLIIQLMFISFSGVTLFQFLMLKGLELTSPAMATAMPNLVPALTFAIAWLFRLEVLKLSCPYSKVKIAGTALCVSGALVTSLLQANDQAQVIEEPNDHISNSNTKTLGCFYLIASVFTMSSNIVMQAQVLKEFSAPISLCAVTSFLGVFTTTLFQLVKTHTFGFGFGSSLLSTPALTGYSFLTATLLGFCVSFNGWAIKKRGPVLASVFSPISAVISAIYSAINLGDNITLGSLGGMLLMFTGLYFVLWSKAKENHVHGDKETSDFDSIRKPLVY